MLYARSMANLGCYSDKKVVRMDPGVPESLAAIAACPGAIEIGPTEDFCSIRSDRLSLHIVMEEHKWVKVREQPLYRCVVRAKLVA